MIEMTKRFLLREVEITVFSKLLGHKGLISDWHQKTPEEH
jgi:hypothetical protein